MTRANEEEEAWRRARDEARQWVRRKRILFTIVGVYAALSVMWLIIDLADDSSGFWFYWPMLGTGIGVAITAVVLLGVGGVFGVDWEQREIDRYMAHRSGHRPGAVRDDDAADAPPGG
jgi:2TM domain